MDFVSLMKNESYTLVVILFILMMILRSNKKILKWTIQWIILFIALVLSFIQRGVFDIDTILNAFIASGICLFGENAMFRKTFEKTPDEEAVLNLVNECKNKICEVADIKKIELTQEEIDEILKKALEDKAKRLTENENK